MYTMLGNVDKRTCANAITMIQEKFADASNDTALLFLPNMVKKLGQVACEEVDGGQVFGQENTLYYFLVDFYSDFGYIAFQDLFGETVHRFSPGEGYTQFENYEKYERLG